MTTYELIETIEVGAGGAANLVFSNIPQTYTDLYLVVSARNTTTNDECWIYPNGSSSGLSYMLLRGSGSTVATGTSGRFYMSISTDTANTFGSGECYIPNYTSSNYKSMSMNSTSENNATAAYQGIQAALWSNTDAITSLVIQFTSGNFEQYSSASLFGIKSYEVTTAKATGGTITGIGNTIYHTFTASGTFTPLEDLDVEYLVVAGGGSGGYGSAVGGGGGGGAGGYLSGTASLTTQPYTITIGAGGTGVLNSSSTPGTSGSNSSLDSLVTSTGGGRGGGFYNSSWAYGPTTGGSGGGALGLSGYLSGAAGIAGQGNSGGNGDDSDGGGGGGGAGGNGISGTATTGGQGGGGLQWLNGYYYAGGGGGSPDGSTEYYASGGIGGGGASALNGGFSGTANTGGGGGGGRDGAGGNGGSGVVIVRYTV